MALEPLIINVRYFFRDSDDTILWGELHLAPDQPALGGLFSQRLIPKMSALTSCQFYETRVTLRVRDWAAYTGDADTRIRQHAAFIFENSIAERFAIAIGGINPAILRTTGPYAGIAIDRTHPAVLAFENIIINGDGTTRAVDFDGNTLDTLAVAYRQFRQVTESDIRKG